MAKGKQDPVAKVERKLTKAQAALQDAQAKSVKAEKRGSKEIEKARALAEQWKAKARSRVEQRQQAVAKLEARLLELKGLQAPLTSELLVTPDSDLSSLELLVTPDSDLSTLEQLVTPDSANGLTEREVQALEALRQVSQEDGAIPGAWQQASHLSDGTFSRVRKALMDRGLVRREGDGRHVRYLLVQNGSVQA
jgi:hypothetical protein